MTRFTPRPGPQQRTPTVAPQSTHAEVIESLIHPTYWLLFGLPWPGGSDPAEAAIAVAPSIIPRTGLGGDARDMLRVADAYADCTAVQAVFLSDLTRWLDRHGSTWFSRGTDWEVGKDELVSGGALALYFVLSQVGHLILCDASRHGATLHYSERTEQVTPTQRQHLRSALEQRLLVDWPDYVHGLLTQGKIRLS